MNGLGQDPKRPIARTAFELESDEFWTVWSEAFLAHLEYFQSGTLHGNINPYVIFADSQTGRGFLADYEYSTNVIAPNGYIPLAVVQHTTFERPSLAKLYQETRENEKGREESVTKAGEAGALANRIGGGDDGQIGPEQGPPIITPPTHGSEAEGPLVPPNK